MQPPGGRVGRIGPVHRLGIVGVDQQQVARLDAREMHLVGVHQECEPSSLTASEKWFATASCMLSRAVQRKAQARSTRSS